MTQTHTPKTDATAKTGRFVGGERARPANKGRVKRDVETPEPRDKATGPDTWVEYDNPDDFLAEIERAADVKIDPEVLDQSRREVAMYAPANKWLEQVRLSRGLTQAELADRVARTQSGISQLENRSIAGRQLNTLAEVLAGLDYALELTAVDPTGHRIVCTIPPAEG